MTPTLLLALCIVFLELARLYRANRDRKAADARHAALSTRLATLENRLTTVEDEQCSASIRISGIEEELGELLADATDAELEALASSRSN